MVGATFFFMLANVSAKYLIQDYHWSQILWIRGMLGVIMFTLLRIIISFPFKRNIKLPIAVISIRVLLEMVMFICFVMAIQTLTLSFAAAIIFVAPLIIVLLGSIILKEQLTYSRIIATFFGFLGAIIIVNPTQPSLDISALAWLLASICCLCINSLLSRKFAVDIHPLMITVALHIAMATIMLPIVYFTWKNIPSFAVLLQFVSMTITAGLGVILFNMAFKLGESAYVAPFYYCEIIWALTFDFILWWTLPDTYVLVGAAIVISAGLYAQLAETKKTDVSITS